MRLLNSLPCNTLQTFIPLAILLFSCLWLLLRNFNLTKSPKIQSAYIALLGFCCSAIIWSIGFFINQGSSCSAQSSDPVVFYFTLLLLIFGGLITFRFTTHHQETNLPYNQPQQQLVIYLLLLTTALGGFVAINHTGFVAFLLGIELVSFCLIAICSITQINGAKVRYIYPQQWLIFLIPTIILCSGCYQLQQALSLTSLNQLTFYNVPQVVLTVAADAASIKKGIAFILIGIICKLLLLPWLHWFKTRKNEFPSEITLTPLALGITTTLAFIWMIFLNLEFPSFTLKLNWLDHWLIIFILICSLTAFLQQHLSSMVLLIFLTHLCYLVVTYLIHPSGDITIPILGQVNFNVFFASYTTCLFLITILLFFTLDSIALRTANNNINAFRLASYKHLFWRHPWHSTGILAYFTIFCALPFINIFAIKPTILANPIDANKWQLLLTIVISSGAILICVLRVALNFMTSPIPPAMILTQKTAAISLGEAPQVSNKAENTLYIILGVCLILWLGIFPKLLLELIQAYIFSKAI